MYLDQSNLFGWKYLGLVMGVEMGRSYSFYMLKFKVVLLCMHMIFEVFKELSLSELIAVLREYLFENLSYLTKEFNENSITTQRIKGIKFCM